jgi:hypothetical protein
MSETADCAQCRQRIFKNLSQKTLKSDGRVDYVCIDGEKCAKKSASRKIIFFSKKYAAKDGYAVYYAYEQGAEVKCSFICNFEEHKGRQAANYGMLHTPDEIECIGVFTNPTFIRSVEASKVFSMDRY